jgi:hypothetical protein
VAISDYQLVHTLLDYDLTETQRKAFSRWIEEMRRNPQKKLSDRQRQWANAALKGCLVSGKLAPSGTGPSDHPERPPTYEQQAEGSAESRAT